MRALVTGAAGFIGSNLCDRLLREGWDVRGVDCFTDYYDPTAKQRNLQDALHCPQFELVAADLRVADLAPLLADVDVVFHQAAQPGVRLSWATGFGVYVEHNINATQRLLEAVSGSAIRRFVYASSSSVYGQAPAWPTTEDMPTKPHSPYGVTKLAAELLCSAYAANFAVPTVSLRYFTVYGPRQRPDMAMHRLIEAARNGVPFPLYGDGSHIRDFTFVGDAVDANVRAALAPDVAPGTTVNVAGGGSTSMSDLIALVESVVGRPIRLDRKPEQAGDVTRTGGSIDLAGATLGWKPMTELAEGVEAQFRWHQEAMG